MFLAFARFSMEVNEKKEAAKKIDEGTKNLIDSITSIFAAGTQHGKQKDSILH